LTVSAGFEQLPLRIHTPAAAAAAAADDDDNADDDGMIARYCSLAAHSQQVSPSSISSAGTGTVRQILTCILK